jgi:hypothetical protein
MSHGFSAYTYRLDEVNLIHNIPPEDIPDFLAWDFDVNGHFSVIPAYKLVLC